MVSFLRGIRFIGPGGPVALRRERRSSEEGVTSFLAVGGWGGGLVADTKGRGGATRDD